MACLIGLTSNMAVRLILTAVGKARHFTATTTVTTAVTAKLKNRRQRYRPQFIGQTVAVLTNGLYARNSPRQLP